MTSPGKGIPNIIYGVKHLESDPDKVDIFSAASCTTNAITPILKAIENSFGVKKWVFRNYSRLHQRPEFG